MLAEAYANYLTEMECTPTQLIVATTFRCNLVRATLGGKDSARRHARKSATIGHVRKAVSFQDRFCLSAAAARAAVDDHRALAIAKFGQTLPHVAKRNVGRARVGPGCEFP